jgi:hypothetical protein
LLKTSSTYIKDLLDISRRLPGPAAPLFIIMVEFCLSGLAPAKFVNRGTKCYEDAP